ncbi:MAG: radical SAM protein [Syntrophobacterales bacterium]|nr:radical SAM protein [Syntrophobacterales bacterium]
MASILLVNPWITDFAAYDLWAKPLGLLFLASLLSSGGVDVAFIDCMDRAKAQSERHPISGSKRFYGTGKYPKRPIEPPRAYERFPRTYYRYGITEELFDKLISDLPERPRLVMVTSMMTYWYPGVQQTIARIKLHFPEVPVWLGGIYAILCREHALKFSGADYVIDIPLGQLPYLLENRLGIPLSNKAMWSSLSLFPPPFWKAYEELSYGVLVASIGCPFSCPYCASPVLQPRVDIRTVEKLYEEISLLCDRQIKDFAFYDDALLIYGWHSIETLLKRLISEGYSLNFHTPNAIHVKAIDERKSELLFQAGFKTLRLGLETASPYHQRVWGNKAENREFARAVRILKKTGFTTDQVGVYLLSGVPGQRPEDVRQAVDFVAEHEVLPFIAEYSPIPRTPMWEKARRVSTFDIENEPLYHNNSFFACRNKDFSYEDMVELKNYTRKVRSALISTSMADSS